MFVYKKLKPSDVSITPFEAHKQYNYDSSSAGNNGITFNSTLWTSESKAHYSADNIAGNFQNHRNYFQFDKVFYRDYITDNSNLIPDVNYIKQERRLYDKLNILSIPQNLFGSRIQPTTFNLTGSFNSGNTIIEINDDGEGNVYPTNYTLGSTNWPSEKGRIVYIAPVKGFKKKDLTVLNGTGHKIVNGSDTFTLENVYDDSYYLNQIDYNNITFIGDTPFLGLNFDSNKGGYLRLDHSELYNFGFNDNFSISFYLDYNPTDLYNELAGFSSDSDQYRRIIAKADVKTIIPSPGEGKSEIISTFTSGNLQPLNAPAENKWPFKIELNIREGNGSGSLSFSRSTGTQTVTITDPRALYTDPGGSELGTTSKLVHICCQKSGDELIIYRDGIKVASGSDLNPNICKGIPPTNEANVYVGMKATTYNDGGNYSQNYGTNFLSGRQEDIKLSQLMIWDSALSETQIQNVSESITGTPYIGNIFYDEGFVTINHPSYIDVFQQYSGSLTQGITLDATYGDVNNYDEVIFVVDSEAWKSNITAYNSEDKVWARTPYGNFNLYDYNSIEDDPLGVLFDKTIQVEENTLSFFGTIDIQHLSSSFLTYSLDSDTPTNNPFTPSGSSTNFIDQGAYLLLSSSATTNTQNVTLIINSSSLLYENFILGGGPGASVHNNLGETIFDYTAENDGGVAVEPFPNQEYVNFTGENNQVHLYDDIGVFKTQSQTVSTTETQLTFQSSFATAAPYNDLPLGSGYPQYLGARGLVAEYYNDRLFVSTFVDQYIHDEVGTIDIQAFTTVNETPAGVHTVTLKLYKNGGATPVATNTFLTSPVVDSTGVVTYSNYSPQQGDYFTLKASAVNNTVGPDSVTFLGGTNSNPKTFIRGINQDVEPGFKNYLSIESDTWSTTAEGYYKVSIKDIRTDNDNYGPLPDEPLNVGTFSDNLGVSIQILKNNNPIHTTVIPKDTNYGDFEYDWIETATGGTYKIKIFITKDNGATNPVVEAFSIDEGFRFSQVRVYGRDKTNQFTITPALAQDYKTISPGNTNNSLFTFDDSAGLIPDDTVINVISNSPNPGTTITLANSYTITSSIGATASYDEQSYLSASAEITIDETAIYELESFELGVDETTNLGATLLPRLRISTNHEGNIINYGPYVGSQNIQNVMFGVLSGSDTIRMDLDIVQNFGTPSSPNYIITATGDGVGFSVDNISVSALFPTGTINRLTGPTFPTTIDELQFFSGHAYNEGDEHLPFTTGSITVPVSYIDDNTVQINGDDLFITQSTTAYGYTNLTNSPISASLFFDAKPKTIYDLKFQYGGQLTGSAEYIGIQLYNADNTLITSSLLEASSSLRFVDFITPEFTASDNGQFKLSIFSSDNAFNPTDVIGGTVSYIGLKGPISSSLLSGSYIITRTDGEYFTSDTATVAITSSHSDEGPFPGGLSFNSASYTTGSINVNVEDFISTTQLQVNSLLFITSSTSEATGSVNLGNTYFLTTCSVQNVGDSLPTPLLEGNFTIGDTTYNITSIDGQTMGITPCLLLTEPTDVTLNYHTTASHDYNIKFKNSHLIFEHEYQCTVDEEEYNYTQNVSVKKNKSNQSADLADCVTGSIENSQITLFKPYLTTVGLYDDYYNLLAVGKFAQPIKMSEETDMTFVIRWDS